MEDRRKTLSVGDGVFYSFCKKYGTDFFFEEVVAKSFTLSNFEYVQDVVTSDGKVIWINPTM